MSELEELEELGTISLLLELSFKVSSFLEDVTLEELPNAFPLPIDPLPPFVVGALGPLGGFVVGPLGGFVVEPLGGFVVEPLGGFVVGPLGGFVVGPLGGFVVEPLGGFVVEPLGGFVIEPLGGFAGPLLLGGFAGPLEIFLETFFPDNGVPTLLLQPALNFSVKDMQQREIQITKMFAL